MDEVANLPAEQRAELFRDTGARLDSPVIGFTETGERFPEIGARFQPKSLKPIAYFGQFRWSEFLA